MTESPHAPATASAVQPARHPRLSIAFTSRDLLNVAIFAVIYFVIIFAVAMLGIISPLVTLLTLPLSAIAAGIPYMLFLTRVRHAGMVTLFGTVIALLYLLMGQPWQSTVITIVLSLVADLVLRTGSYRSKRAAVWTYVVFSAWFAGPYIPFFLDPTGYLSSSAMQAYGAEYVRQFAEFITIPTVTVMIVATMVCGFLGALLGTALLRKHFAKAGLA